MAAANSTDICNMALDSLGKPTITDINENTVEARSCLRQYDTARRLCLSRSPWSFARRHRSLPLLATNTLSDLWGFCYDRPNDMLQLFAVLPAGATPLENVTPAPYYPEDGKLYSNIEDAWAYYVWDNANTLSWSSEFDDVVALYMALRLVPNATRRKSDAETLREMYTDALALAIEQDAAQEPTSYIFDSDGYVASRNSGSERSGRAQADGSSIWGN